MEVLTSSLGHLSLECAILGVTDTVVVHLVKSDFAYIESVKQRIETDLVEGDRERLPPVGGRLAIPRRRRRGRGYGGRRRRTQLSWTASLLMFSFCHRQPCDVVRMDIQDLTPEWS